MKTPEVLIVNDMGGQKKYVGATGTTVYPNLERELMGQGMNVSELTSESLGLINYRLALYPQINVVVNPWPIVKETLERSKADYIHIATVEQPLGAAAMIYCAIHKIPFTISYRINLPAYMREYCPGLESYKKILTRFLARLLYGSATQLMVPNESAAKQLQGLGVRNQMKLWERGVDLDLFHPSTDKVSAPKSAKIRVGYIGRFAKEKHLERFLDAGFNWPKLEVSLVGSGPLRENLIKKYPTTQISGPFFGEELAAKYRALDVFIEPSDTDLAPNRVVEALASGVPVLAFDVIGPKDIITDGVNGILVEFPKNLAEGFEQVEQINKKQCRQSVLHRTWRRSAEQFVDNLVPR